MKRVHLVISGDVQGVGYRAWVLRQAQDLQVVGWVKNRDDKAVELVAEGLQDKLEELVKRCQHGPDLPAIAALRRWQAGVAWVEKVDVQWLSVTGEFLVFEVIY